MATEVVDSWMLDLFFISISVILILLVGLKLFRILFLKDKRDQVNKVMNISSNHQLTVVNFQDMQYTLLLHKQGGVLLNKKQLNDGSAPQLDLSRKMKKQKTDSSDK